MNTSLTTQSQQLLMQLFSVALQAVYGQSAVERQLKNEPIQGDVAVIAVGKAATAMMLAAQNKLKEQIHSALIITKEGYADSSLEWPCIEAGHPIPNTKSLYAGEKLVEFIANIPSETSLLALISGGASALAEVLPDSMDLQILKKANHWLLSSGLDIYQMNRVRQSISLIKGGKALQHLSQKKMLQFLISDVRFDDPEIIGSGLFVATNQNKHLPEIPAWLHEYIQTTATVSDVYVESRIVANNEIACQAVIEQATLENHQVTYHGQTLYGDVFELAEQLAQELLSAEKGIHIWGGEPTIELPDNPSRGGRNQSLALALACNIENSNNLTILIGATDGSDGPTEDAGAIVDGNTIERGGSIEQAKDSLVRADAGTFLAEAGALISTGPTGSNVMDIVIALKK